MPSPQELEAKFWKALQDDMTVMLGLIILEFILFDLANYELLTRISSRQEPGQN